MLTQPTLLPVGTVKFVIPYDLDCLQLKRTTSDRITNNIDLLQLYNQELNVGNTNDYFSKKKKAKKILDVVLRVTLFLLLHLHL